MMPEDVKQQVFENKKVPFYKLQSDSAIRNFMDTVRWIKSYKVYTIGPGDYIVVVKFPWYYVWPIGYFCRQDIQKQVNLLKSKHIKIEIKKFLI